MSIFKRKNNKIKIEDEVFQLLEEFRNIYNPKNPVIEEIICNAKSDLEKGQVPQVVLQKFIGSIYSMSFIEKIKFGNDINPILKKMDKLSRSNGFLQLGGLSTFRL